jgi:hypothetical protein
MAAERRFHVRAARAGTANDFGQQAEAAFVMAVAVLAVLIAIMIIEPLKKFAVDMMIAAPLAIIVASMVIIVPLIISAVMPLIIAVIVAVIIIMPLTIAVIVAVVIVVPLIIAVIVAVIIILPLIIAVIMGVIIIMPLIIAVIVAMIIILPLIIAVIVAMTIILPLIIPVILTGIIIVLRIITVAPRVIAVFTAGVPPPVHAVIPAIPTITAIPVIGVIPAVTVHHALYPCRLAVTGMRRPLVRDVISGVLFFRHFPVYERVLRVFGYRADVRIVITLGYGRAQGVGRRVCRRLRPGRFLSRLADPVSQEPPERTVFSVRDCHRAKPVIETGLVSKLNKKASYCPSALIVP